MLIVKSVFGFRPFLKIPHESGERTYAAEVLTMEHRFLFFNIIVVIYAPLEMVLGLA